MSARKGPPRSYDSLIHAMERETRPNLTRILYHNHHHHHRPLHNNRNSKAKMEVATKEASNSILRAIQISVECVTCTCMPGLRVAATLTLGKAERCLVPENASEEREGRDW